MTKTKLKKKTCAELVAEYPADMPSAEIMRRLAVRGVVVGKNAVYAARYQAKQAATSKHTNGVATKPAKVSEMLDRAVADMEEAASPSPVRDFHHLVGQQGTVWARRQLTRIESAVGQLGDE